MIRHCKIYRWQPSTWKMFTVISNQGNKVKNTVRCEHTPLRMSLAPRGPWRPQPSLRTAGGAEWSQPFGKDVWEGRSAVSYKSALKKSLKSVPQYVPATPLLGAPSKNGKHVHAAACVWLYSGCVHDFWKPKCCSSGEWIGIFIELLTYSARKRNALAWRGRISPRAVPSEERPDSKAPSARLHRTIPGKVEWHGERAVLAGVRGGRELAAEGRKGIGGGWKFSVFIAITQLYSSECLDLCTDARGKALSIWAHQGNTNRNHGGMPSIGMAKIVGEMVEQLVGT